MQSKKMSLIEALSSVAIGYIIKRIYYANQKAVTFRSIGKSMFGISGWLAYCLLFISFV